MAHIAISGASSFIGKALVNRLIMQGHQVTAIVRNPNAFENRKDVCCVQRSMNQYSDIGDAVGMCDCYVHLAWNGTRGADRMNEQMQKQNVTDSLVAVSSMLNGGCKKIITAGSQAEYGPHQQKISETTDCMPNTPYGKEKLRFYIEAQELCQKHRAKIIEPRIFSIYGPGDNEKTMIMSMIHNMLNNLPCNLTKGIQMWDFLYIEDAAEAITQLCLAENANGVYNLGSGDIRELKEYIKQMKKACHSKSELNFGAIPYPETGMTSIWPDTSKINKELTWRPQWKFEEGVQRIIDTYSLRS